MRDRMFLNIPTESTGRSIVSALRSVAKEVGWEELKELEPFRFRTADYSVVFDSDKADLCLNQTFSTDISDAIFLPLHKAVEIQRHPTGAPPVAIIESEIVIITESLNGGQMHKRIEFFVYHRKEKTDEYIQVYQAELSVQERSALKKLIIGVGRKFRSGIGFGHTGL